MPHIAHISRGELSQNYWVWELRTPEDEKWQIGNLEDKELSPSDPAWKGIVKVASLVFAANWG